MLRAQKKRAQAAASGRADAAEGAAKSGRPPMTGIELLAAATAADEQARAARTFSLTP